MSLRYSRDGYSVLIRKRGGFIGGWGGEMLCVTLALEHLYEVKAESDLTKTQNCQVNYEQDKFVETGN